MINNMIKNQEDMERFLYGDEYSDRLADPVDQIWIKKVEEALGFKLFFWQKIMITGMTREYGRRTGKSLTWALQKLHGTLPIDMRRKTIAKMNERTSCNYRLLVDVAEMLDQQNVPHAQICRSEKEWDIAIMHLQKTGRMNGKSARMFIVDEFVLSDNV